MALLSACIMLVGCSTYLSFSDIPAQELRLPPTFVGTFFWDDTPALRQKVTVFAKKNRQPQQGLLVVYGEGLYETNNGSTRIDIRIEVSLTTDTSLRFEMWEANPSGDGSFITDGSHLGTISQDFRDIRATWTTRSTGRTGTLRLQAP